MGEPSTNTAMNLTATCPDKMAADIATHMAASVVSLLTLRLQKHEELLLQIQAELRECLPHVSLEGVASCEQALSARCPSHIQEGVQEGLLQHSPRATGSPEEPQSARDLPQTHEQVGARNDQPLPWRDQPPPEETSTLVLPQLPPASNLPWFRDADASQAISAIEEMAEGHKWPPQLVTCGEAHAQDAAMKHLDPLLRDAAEPIRETFRQGSHITQASMSKSLFDNARAVKWWFKTLEEPRRDGALASVVFSSQFKMAIACLVCANCILHIQQANDNMDKVAHGDGGHSDFEDAEIFFVSAFAVEVLLKLVLHRWYFFCNDAMFWNWLDLGLIVLAVFREFVGRVIGNESSVSTTFMRSLRLLKITRLFRIVKVFAVFRDLRLMLNAVGSSCLAVAWAMLLVLFVLLICGLVLLQGMAQHCHYQILEKGIAFLESEEYSNVMRLFGSLSITAMTLFQATTGGADWGEPFDILQNAHSFYASVFVLYICFFQFALFNILTGIIVDTMDKSADCDDDEVMREREDLNKSILKEIRTLFESLDSDDSGTLSKSEFYEHIKSPLVQAYFSGIQVESTDAEYFFRALLDLHGSDSVPIDAFVQGCERMRGWATRVDVQALSAQLTELRRSQKIIEDRQHHDGRFLAVAISAALNSSSFSGIEPNAVDAQHRAAEQI